MSADLVLMLPLLLFSIIAHEYAHGAVANRFGDDTARLMGRLSFNPVVHIDPVGTILLPLLCVVSNAPLFGWAKPVPVNPNRLENRPLSTFLVAAVGPISNLFLACLCSFFLQIITHALSVNSSTLILARALNYGILINLYLCAFNLLPIPPLDGSKALESLLPAAWAHHYSRLEAYSVYILMLFMFTGLAGRIVSPLVSFLYHFLLGAPA